MSTTEFRPIRIFNTRSREFVIATKLNSGKSRDEVMKELAPKIGQDSRWIYYENKSGRRGRPSEDSIAKPIKDQFRLFIWTVDKTIKAMEGEGWSNPETRSDKKRWNSKERTWVAFRDRYASELMRLADSYDVDDDEPSPPTPSFQEIPEPGSVEPVIEGKEDEKKELPPLPADEKDSRGNIVVTYEYDEDGKVVRVEHELPPVSRANDIDFFFEIMMRARAFTSSRELSGEYLDFISTRVIKDGANAIAHGVRVDEVVEAVTKTWPQDSKNEFSRSNEKWKPKARSIDPRNYKHKAILPGAHAYLGYVIHLAEARIPIFLVGPSGCGKSFLARDLAEALDEDYGELPLTAGATPSWLVGAETISGYKSRPFVEIYHNGGVFCFEEIDAADPNMLLLVNNALANEALTNPVTGEEISKSDDFIPVATANTWGLGANRQFTGRERLDAATLDRWRVGRVEMDYDPDVEKNIVNFWKEEAIKLEKPKPVKAVRK